MSQVHQTTRRLFVYALLFVLFLGMYQVRRAFVLFWVIGMGTRSGTRKMMLGYVFGRRGLNEGLKLGQRRRRDSAGLSLSLRIIISTKS